MEVPETSQQIQLTTTPSRLGLLKDGIQDFTVMVSLKAPFFEEKTRAAVDIMTVIDRSGSMQGAKIDLVKETLKFVVKQLRIGDTLSIVLYDHEVETLLLPTEMNSSGKERANMVISGITSRGSTDLCAGLLRGIDVIKTSKKNEVASVLLFTDGLVNAGIQNIDQITAEIAKKEENGKLPCTIHSFGFGSDHALDILKNIADKGNGTYFFIENKDTIPNAFADCLGGLLSVVGQNLVLELQGDSGAVLTKVETTFKSLLANGKALVTIGDIQSEEEKDILCTLQTPKLEEQQQINIIDAKVSYFNVLSSKQEETAAYCSLKETADYLQLPENEKIDIQKNRIKTTEALSQAKQLGDTGSYSAARDLLDKAIQALKQSISANSPYVQSLVRDLEDSKSGLQDRHSYTSYGGYQMASYSSAHTQQRATHTTQAYSTTSRFTMASKLDSNFN